MIFKANEAHRKYQRIDSLDREVARTFSRTAGQAFLPDSPVPHCVFNRPAINEPTTKFRGAHKKTIRTPPIRAVTG